MLLLCPSLNWSAVRSSDAESAGHWVECACASNEMLAAVYMGTLVYATIRKAVPFCSHALGLQFDTNTFVFERFNDLVNDFRGKVFWRMDALGEKFLLAPSDHTRKGDQTGGPGHA